MNLAPVQSMLERIYAVTISQDVGDFLVTDPRVTKALDQSTNARICDEKLLVRSDGEDLALTLFIDQQVMRRLALDDPYQRLHDQNLGDFLMALEGVSHFLYLVHRASHSREVTRLELELQAEVDKYVTVNILARSQGVTPAPGNVLRELFTSVQFDEQMDCDERERYMDANSLAGRYCEHLETRFLSARSRAEFFEELRTFYSMSQPDKLRHIARAR
jgi:hypothetical protein